MVLGVCGPSSLELLCITDLAETVGGSAVGVSGSKSAYTPKSASSIALLALLGGALCERLQRLVEAAFSFGLT